MIRVIASIHHRRINNKLKYFQHFTFSSELATQLKWKAGMKLAISENDLALELYPDKEGFILGQYRNRPGVLWLNFGITAIQRRDFLRLRSNKVAVKVCWRPHLSSFAINNQCLTLYGSGHPFNKGVNRIK